MDLTLYPRRLQGTVAAIPSKSMTHRYLICAALADKPTDIFCHQTSLDMDATARCLCALGAEIEKTDFGYRVSPICKIPKKATLDCGESGSTLRFLLPIVGALGVHGTFLLAGRLAQRPLTSLWEEMERMGCQLSRPAENSILCQGKLTAGTYQVSGNISSQYITGLLFACTLIPGSSTLSITSTLESAPYVRMTEAALEDFGISTNYDALQYAFPYHSPGKICVEGDWSNAAFFFAANTLGSDIQINGLNDNSTQGDKAISKILSILEQKPVIDATDIPDLVPILAVAAGVKQGATFINIRRLRMKESDRVASVAAMLTALGLHVDVEENQMTVHPGTYKSTLIDSQNDHRIAMAAAIAATVADGPVTITNAQCVDKSYPQFWDIYKQLGGQYEQYIR